jgi:Phytanoyl-CoA dioxygenase (PhyH)
MDRTSSLASEIESVGYVLVPGVLDPTKVAELRFTVDRVLDERGIAKAGGTVLPNAASLAPEIAWVLTHDPILEAVRGALECNEPVFTLEADLHRNYLARHWHKDTGEQVMDRGYFGLDSFGRSDCRVVKVAIYLQDHDGDRRGLRVRPGSHRDSDLGSGNGVAIASRAGDAVLFDVRISHRGISHGVLDLAAAGVARVGPRKSRSEAESSWRRRLGRLTARQDRLAIYFAFGIPNGMSDAFASRNMARQLSQLGQTSFELPSQLVGAFGAIGVKIAPISSFLM